MSITPENPLTIPAASLRSLLYNVRHGLSDLPIAVGSLDELEERFERLGPLFDALDRFADGNHFVALDVHYADDAEYAWFEGEEKRAEKVKGERQTIWKERTEGGSMFAVGGCRIVVFKPRGDSSGSSPGVAGGDAKEET